MTIKEPIMLLTPDSTLEDLGRSTVVEGASLRVNIASLPQERQIFQLVAVK